MAFSADELTAITTLLDEWAEGRVPIMVRDELVLQYRITRHDVLLFEKRPAFRAPGEWTERHVAKFRFNRRRGTWSLLWRDRHVRWHTYEPLPLARELRTLVEEVDRDPAGIFWG